MWNQITVLDERFHSSPAPWRKDAGADCHFIVGSSSADHEYLHRVSFQSIRWDILTAIAKQLITATDTVKVSPLMLLLLCLISSSCASGNWAASSQEIQVYSKLRSTASSGSRKIFWKCRAVGSFQRFNLVLVLLLQASHFLTSLSRARTGWNSSCS